MTTVDRQNQSSNIDPHLTQLKWAGGITVVGLCVVNKLLEGAQGVTTFFTKEAFWAGRVSANLPPPTVFPASALGYTDYRVGIGAAAVFGLGFTYGYLKVRRNEKARDLEAFKDKIRQTLAETKNTPTVQEPLRKRVTVESEPTRHRTSRAGKAPSRHTKTGRVANTILETASPIAKRTRSKKLNGSGS